MSHGSTSEGLLWRYVPIVYLLVIAFPGDYQAVRPGLDPSWTYALNYLPQTAFVFGKDFVHTYGPLGYLLHPLDVGSNLVYATAFRLAIHCLFAACLLYLAQRSTNMFAVLACAIGYALAMVVVITLEFSYQLLVVELLLFLVSLTDKRAWWIAAPLCAVIAGLLLFVKFGLGVAAAAILLPANVVWFFRDRPSMWMVALVPFGFYFATIILLSAIYLGSTHDLLLWIQRSLIISDEFSVAQSIVGSNRFLALALGALAIYIGIVLSLFRQNSPLRFVAPVLAVALFLSFKHGFVRVYGHERNFFPFLLASISVLALVATTKGELRTLVAGYILVLIASVPVGTYYAAKLGLPPAYSTLLGLSGYKNIVSTVRLNETRKNLDRVTAANLQSRPLPAAWVTKIRTEKATVDAIPWELSYVFANNLRWKPNVTLQLFASWTPFLDRWNARHFAGHDSPDFLIVEFLAIDGRHLLLDTPAAARSVVANYSVDGEERERNLALLKRRPRPLSDAFATSSATEIRLGQWVDVPPSEHLLFADLEMSLSPFGALSKFLFRIPPAYLDVVYDSGKETSYRITPEVAIDGLLVNYLPADQNEFFDLLSGCTRDRVTRFRISGPALRYYREPVALRWEQGLPVSRLSGQRACGS